MRGDDDSAERHTNNLSPRGGGRWNGEGICGGNKGLKTLQSRRSVKTLLEQVQHISQLLHSRGEKKRVLEFYFKYFFGPF